MIIQSLLDTDFYTFTQGQMAFHQFTSTQVEYKFKCRNGIKWSHKHLVRLREEIKSFCKLRFSEDELDYLSGIRFFKSSYIDFLRLYQPSIKHIVVQLIDNELQIIIKGPWFLTIYFEVPVLAMVSEIYSTDIVEDPVAYGVEALNETIEKASNDKIPLADFGTRRRHSFNWHRFVVEQLKKHCASFIGTSNVLFAKEFGLKPIGTMSHQMFQVAQALEVQLVDSQKKMLQAWSSEFRGDLGIALTDTIGVDAFLRDFDLYFAKLYDGVRHDSGSAEDWADKIISHYKSLGLDSKYKSLVFSDGLDIDKAALLYEKYKDSAKVSFGIGTNLTNNLKGFKAPSVVIKITKCNGKPVAKISDSPGKIMCEDEGYINYLKKVFNR